MILGILPQGDPRFTVVAGDPAVPAVRVATVEGLLPRAIEKAAPSFPGTPLRPFRVVLHRSVGSLPAGLREQLHPKTPGLALLGRDEIHIVLDEVELRPPNDLATVVTHEVVHVLLDQYAGAFGPRVPRWLHEGLAQHLSGDTYLGSREEDLVFPAVTGRLLRFQDLEDDFPDDADQRKQAYAQSFSFVAYLSRTVGLEEVVSSVHYIDDRFGYAGAFARRTQTPLSAHEDAWIAWLRDESGARWRFLFQNCFSYLMIAGFVLLALAGIRRLRRDEVARQKLEREDARHDSEDRPR